MMNRRNILIGTGASVLIGAGLISQRNLAFAGNDKTSKMNDTMRDNNMNTDINWNEISKTEWKTRLTDAEFHVLRKEGTERPFSAEFKDEKRAGVYACAGCGLPLFKAVSKYESGTGWPSFFQPIEGNVETKRDFKMLVPRTEYHCKRCGGHQGHVFKDGPKPSGLRYCNNGVALDFVPS